MNVVSYIERVFLIFSACNLMKSYRHVSKVAPNCHILLIAVYSTCKCQERLVLTFFHVITLRLMWNSPDILRFAEQISEETKTIQLLQGRISVYILSCSMD